jgi:hypothetical protein
MWEDDPAKSLGVELYTHVGDDGSDFDAFENSNQAAANPAAVATMRALLRAVVANQTRL